MIEMLALPALTSSFEVILNLKNFKTDYENATMIITIKNQVSSSIYEKETSPLFSW